MRFWNRLEDKWYAALDRLDEAHIPVYSLVDSIDKIAPSLAVFFLLIIAVVAGIVFSQAPILSSQTHSILVMDEAGNPLIGVPLSLSGNNSPLAHVVTDEDGRVTVLPSFDTSLLTLTINHAWFKPYTETKNWGGGEWIVTLHSTPQHPADPPFEVSIQGNNHSPLNGIAVEVLLYCTSGVDYAQNSQTVTQGKVSITPPFGCGPVVGVFSAPGYYPSGEVLVSPEQPLVQLKPHTYPLGSYSLFVFDSLTNNPLSGMRAELFSKDGPSERLAFTDESGNASFSSLPHGDYFLIVSDSSQKYATIQNDPFALTGSASLLQGMSFVAGGGFSISTYDAATDAPVGGVSISVRENATSTMVYTGLTPGTGMLPPFIPASKGSYSVIATKEGYHANEQTVTHDGASKKIDVYLIPVSAGNPVEYLKVKVLDSYDAPVFLSKVYVSNANGEWNSLHGFTYTDAQGNAMLPFSKEGPFYITAQKYPYETILQPVQVQFPLGDEPVVLHVNTISPLVSAQPTPDSYENPFVSPFPECGGACEHALTIQSATTTLFPGAQTTLPLTIIDESGNVVPDAFVGIALTSPGNAPVLVNSTYSSTAGTVEFSVPASLPGTRVTVFAHKENYIQTDSVWIVGNSIVSVSPEPITLVSPLIPSVKSSASMTLSNPSNEIVRVTDVQVNGYPGIYLALGTLPPTHPSGDNPLVIGPHSSATITIPFVTHPIIPQKPLTQKGSVVFSLKIGSSPTEWLHVSPLFTQMVLPGGCDGPSLSFNEGTDTAFTIPVFEPIQDVTIPFTPSCTHQNIPLPLRNLQARVAWNGTPSGIVEVDVADLETGKMTSAPLSETYSILLATLQNNGHPYEATVRFIPTPGTPGNQGSFTLEWAVETGPESEPVLTSQFQSYTTLLGGLESCIKVNPLPANGITLTSDQVKATFTIDATACHTPVNISFCPEKGNTGCSGGAPQGKIGVGPWKINGLEGKQTITVTRTDATLPGSYDITLHAGVGSTQGQLTRVNVRVDPPSEYAFDMLKTRFTTFGKGSSDSSAVLNTLFQEKVAVTAGTCDWITVSKDNDPGTFGPGFWAGTVASVGLAQLFPNLVVEVVIYSATSATGTTTLALTPCPVCLIVGIIVTLIVDFLLASSEEVDICEILFEVEDMDDYVINLTGITKGDEVLIPPDAIDVKLSDNVAPHIMGEWSTENVEGALDDGSGSELAGVVFTNTSGYANTHPLFGVATLRAIEHIHGDESHAGDGKVTCANGEFRNYKIGPEDDQGECEGAEDIIREEAFHVRFKTAEEDGSLAWENSDIHTCDAGFVTGTTGTGVLPRVAFNWRWNDEVGIPLRACDASNPNAIYCDATQFNIDLMKRIRALEDFLAANNYQFTCPTDPTATPDNQSVTVDASVEPGQIKVTQYGYDFLDTQEVEFDATVLNNTSTPQTIKVKVDMIAGSTLSATAPPGSADYSCETIGNLIPEQAFTFTCSIPGLAPDNYTVLTRVIDVTASKELGIYSYSVNAAKYAQNTPVECAHATKSTKSINGEPSINQWINAQDEQFGEYVNEDNVIFTKTVPNVDALNRLLHFEAYLIRDGYSEDFEKDFRDYYTNVGFADAPPWFKGSTGIPGYASLYGKEDTFEIRNKYFGGNYIQASGKYRVDVEVEMEGDDWKFFDEEGNPLLRVNVQLSHIEDPYPNSPFYRLPFDGELGLVNGEYHRDGYGLGYSSSTGIVYVNDYPIRTFADPEGKGYHQLSIRKSDDLYELNTNPETRGMILSLNVPTGTGKSELVFRPSLATPVMMRVNASLVGKPHSIFYQLSQAGNPVDVGNTLTYWDAVGACHDFSGKNATQVFHHTPDRHGKTNDKLTDWPLVYALDWTNVASAGSLPLSTIFYLPVQETYTLTSESPGVSFLTPNYGSYSSTQILDGVVQSTHNNASSYVDSLQDVFDLVGNQSLCLYDTGVTAQFFWNPAYLHTQKGTTTIEKETLAWNPSLTCI